MRLCAISPGVVHAVPRTVAMADQFEEVHFIDCKGDADYLSLEANGIVYHLPMNKKKGNSSVFKLQRLLHDIKPDVIVCHYASGDHFFNAIVYNKCPVAVVCMGHDILYHRGVTYVPLLRRLLIRMGLKRVSYISAKSKYLIRRLSDFNINCKIDLNYWGADLNFFTKQGNPKKSEVSKIDPVILSPRAIDPTYNILLIVETFKKIVADYPNAKLIIVGRVNSEYKNKVEKRIVDLSLIANVDLVYEVGQEDLLGFYQAADLVISMASSEGFPNTILEVMGCRTPILVGRIPQIEELLIDGHNAKICDFDADQIAEALIDLIKNPIKTNLIVENAFKTVTIHGDINKNAKRFSNQLKDAFEINSGGGWIRQKLFLLIYVIYILQRKLFSL